MQNLVYIFIGGGLGSMCRHGISQYFISHDSAFPLATIITNIAACIVLGLLLGLQTRDGFSHMHSLLLMTGFCGGFSTFSTFSSETMALLQNNQIGLALLYIGLSIVLSLVAIYIGYKIETYI